MNISVDCLDWISGQRNIFALRFLPTPMRPTPKLNACRGQRQATGQKLLSPFRRQWLATQSDHLREAKELRSRKWEERCKRLDELLAMRPEISQALDMKECMLEVQKLFLGKVAAEQNRLNGLANTTSQPLADLDQQIKEAEEAIRAMQY